MFVVLSLERSAVGERESGVVGSVARCGLGDRVTEGSRRLWKEEGCQELLSAWKGSVQQHSRWMGWVMYQSPFGLFLCDSFAVGLLVVRRVTRHACLLRCQCDPSLIVSQPGGGDRFFISSIKEAVLERSVTLESLCCGIGFGALKASSLISVYICYCYYYMFYVFAFQVAISMRTPTVR